MNVLFVGGAKASWAMRGIQMAAELGARATVRPRQADWAWADVVVLVKGAAQTYWSDAAGCGKPVVWDVVDFWMQPRDNHLPIREHVARVKQVAKECRASLLIGATQAMADDIGGVYLPHHCRIGLTPTPPRPKAEIVAYDGSARYLGRWKDALEAACTDLGLRFVVNPPDLSVADVHVALRDAEWDGPACRSWKSNVKFANALAAGRPILAQGCMAFAENHPPVIGATLENFADVRRRIQFALDPAVQWFAYEAGVEHAETVTLEAVAAQYRAILKRFAKGRAA